MRFFAPPRLNRDEPELDADSGTPFPFTFVLVDESELGVEGRDGITDER